MSRASSVLAVQCSSTGRFFVCLKAGNLLGSGEFCKFLACHGASPPGVYSLAPLTSFLCLYYTTKVVISQYAFRNLYNFFRVEILRDS